MYSTAPYHTLLIATLMLFFATNVSGIEANYSVVWHKAEEQLEVSVCFTSLNDVSDTTFTLQNFDRELSSALLWANQKESSAQNRNATKVNVKNRRNRIIINTVISPCVEYAVSVRQRGRYPYVFENNTLVLPTHSWFWSHEDLVSAHFDIRDQNGKPLNFTLPWPEINSHYQLQTTPLSWYSRTLIGDVQTYKIRLSKNRSITASLVGSLNKTPQRWQTWLQNTATAVETGIGYFPLDKANILVAPARSRSSPVPWGEVQRGGYPSVHFFINPNKSQQAFNEDWTASHEMSHLFVPLISWRDRWLSEGIASYYQNVLRARAGMLTKEQAWQKIIDGFDRGRRDFNNRSLRNVNKTMHLYWGGVGFYLLADLRLRESDSSLDAVLRAYNQCCFELDRAWGAEELMALFDDLSGTKVFSVLLKNEAAAKAFPISKAFEQPNNPLLIKHLGAILSPPQ